MVIFRVKSLFESTSSQPLRSLPLGRLTGHQVKRTLPGVPIKLPSISRKVAPSGNCFSPSSPTSKSRSVTPIHFNPSHLGSANSVNRTQTIVDSSVVSPILIPLPRYGCPLVAMERTSNDTAKSKGWSFIINAMDLSVPKSRCEPVFIRLNESGELGAWSNEDLTPSG